MVAARNLKWKHRLQDNHMYNPVTRLNEIAELKLELNKVRMVRKEATAKPSKAKLARSIMEQKKSLEAK